MRLLENNYGWNSIETAPLDKDVTLEVTDGRGSRCRTRRDHCRRRRGPGGVAAPPRPRCGVSADAISAGFFPPPAVYRPKIRDEILEDARPGAGP
jgi:hypothetical protein